MREFEYYLYENFDADQEAGNTRNPRNFLGKETDAILSLIAEQPVNTCAYTDCCDKFGPSLIRKLIEGGVLRRSGKALALDCPIFLREDAAVFI